MKKFKKFFTLLICLLPIFRLKNFILNYLGHNISLKSKIGDIAVKKLIADGRRRAIPYSYRPDTQIDDKKTVEAQYEIQQIDFPQGRNLINKIDMICFPRGLLSLKNQTWVDW